MRESRYLEFKSQITNTFLKTVSAYANFGKGEIKFGITDEGTILGVDDPDRVCIDVENMINDSISPKPDFSFDINRKSRVVTLIVFEGYYKPYLYKGKAYKRNEKSTVEVDRIELNRLILEGNNQYFEEIKSGEKNLMFSIMQRKFSEKLGIKEINVDILKTLNLYDDSTGYNRAAELLADVNHYPGIDIARFGESIDEILDRETIEHVSIFKQYDDAVDLFKKYYQYEKIEGFERKLKERIPEKAFREVIANAIIHRTWDINAHIRVAMYADKIEIMSPGGLPFGLKEEDYLKGQISLLRNPILGSIFFRLHYIEMFGTGIKRIHETYAQYTMKPVFEIYENSIKVTLPVIDAKPSFTSDEESVYKILKSGKQLSSSEISSHSGFGKDKTIRLLNSLAEKKYIRVIGNGRGTKYTV